MAESACPTVVDHHYERVASTYGTVWFYEDGTDYQKFLLRALKAHLEPLPTSKVVDLGAGTCNFSRAFNAYCGLQQPVLCVEPICALLEQGHGCHGVEPLVADGLEFVAMNRYSYDRLFLKEVIHHFGRQQLAALFQGVYRQLHHGGRIVIMTRPHDSSHYPFFNKAHEAWSAAQLRESVYVEALETAGFSASVRLEDYMVSMPTARWFQMIKSRFWSNLAGFTQEEIEEGLREISQARDVGETLHFPDRLVFIVGEKV